ncbi:MAG: cadherin domain-containing protein, partial [Bacteroidales bacterium]|nr:cadherin domain-containing protein [Bacteroidales bacterium]
MMSRRISQGIWFLFFMAFISTIKTESVSAAYDSTYVLAVKQKFAIPEDVRNGDDVGTWLKTWTWMSGNPVSYAIQKNFNGAFSINAQTGLIKIVDFANINGKIVQQDTIINLIIRSTDSVFGYEDDTCEIRIKEKSYCKFIDLDADISGTGTKASPYNSPADFVTKAGFGYFFKRATSFINAFIDFRSGLTASSAHPTIFGAYGTGDKPQFIGKDGGNNFFSYLGNWNYPTTRQCEYIYWYDLHVRNYPQSAWYTVRISDHLGWYNCTITNCDIKGTGSSSFTLINEFPDVGSISDSSRVYDFEIINAYFDTTGTGCTSGCEKSFIKGAQGALIENCYFGQIHGTITPGYQIRLSQGCYPVLKHCWFESIPGYTAAYNYAHVQLRADHARIIDCIFNGFGNGIYISSPGTAGNEVYPDDLLVKNCYFKNMDYSGIYASPGEGNAANHSTGNIIEDSRFINVPLALSLRDWNNPIIRRNLLNGSGPNGIVVRENAVNFKISHNVIYGFTTNQINLSIGSGHEIYNNTINGIINCTGSESEKAYNNYASSFESIETTSNNIDIDTINVLDHFSDFENADFMLLASAFSAINEGRDVGYEIDYLGYPIENIRDIGAYEYRLTNDELVDNPDDTESPGETPVTTPDTEPEETPVTTPDTEPNNPPVIANQQFVINEKNLINLSIGQVFAYDNDNGQKLTFSILNGNDAMLFVINSQTGELKLTSSDIFKENTYKVDLTIEVTDNGTIPQSRSAKISFIFIGNPTKVHIDPNNLNDKLEDGSIQHPFDSWKDVHWEKGSSYLQKSGTIANEDKILIGADDVTLGSYSEGDLPIITSNTNTYLISGFEKKGINIRNLNIQAPNAVSSIYFLGSNSDSIIVEHCQLNANVNAIKVANGNALVVRYNSISSHGEGVYSSATDNQVYYNIFKNCQEAINIMGNS